MSCRKDNEYDFLDTVKIFKSYLNRGWKGEAEGEMIEKRSIGNTKGKNWLLDFMGNRGSKREIDMLSPRRVTEQDYLLQSDSLTARLRAFSRGFCHPFVQHSQIGRGGPQSQPRSVGLSNI